MAPQAIWTVLWYWLVQVGSTIPVADAFTTALCFVGIWPLVREYLEQWLIWIVVDKVTCEYYFYRWVLLIGFVRFRDYLRGQMASEQRSYAGITTELTCYLSRRESERWQNVTHDFIILFRW